MTPTSKTLKRLGIAGLAAATIGAGVPALVASAAQAVGPVTAVTISPTASTAPAGVCINYTIHANDTTGNANGATITVRVTTSNAAHTGAGTATQDVDFCTAAQTGFTAGSTTKPAPQQGQIVSNQGPQTSGTSTDVARFVTDANGNVTFGVVSNEPGGANIQTFVDTNGNGAFDAGELSGGSATATWTNGGPAGSNQNQAAASTVTVAPTSDVAVVGETRAYSVTVRSSDPTGANQTNTLAGVVVSYEVYNKNTAAPVPNPNNYTGGRVQGPTQCPNPTNNNGVTSCNVTFPTAGTYTVRFFVNQAALGSTPGYDSGEPFADVDPVTVQAAPTGAYTVTATCGAASTTPAAANQPETSAASSSNACVNEVRDQNRAIRFVVDNSSAGGASTTGTALSFTVTGGSGDETVTSTGTNPNECTTANNTATDPTATPAGSATDSFCDVTVSDPTPVSGEVLTVTATVRGTSSKGTATVTFRNQPADARNIALAPKTATTAPNTARTFTATVVDSLGKPVQGVHVTFTESGPGAFRNGSSTNTGVTDASGQASVETISLPGETGTQTITATIDADQDTATAGTQATQCGSKAGGNGAASGTTPTGEAVPASQTAGNCSDTATNTFASPSPSPSSSTTPPAGAKPVLSTSTPDIEPNIQGKLTATGITPNAVYELRCYSRPSTTYFTARTVTAGATDSSVNFTILPGTNTRCYVRPQGNEANASNSVVINVHTSLSLSAYRDGVRKYHFQGTNLPRRSGQLITLYRWARADNNGYCDPHVADNDYTATSTDPNCVAVRTAIAYTNDSNVWRIDRTFTGSGQFVFMAKTSQNLTNAAGVSNLRLTIIH